MANFVRSFRTNARIRSLTTGTFNRVVKDRIAFRLSGAYSISPDSHKCESDCPRNRYNHTVRRRLRQRERPTEFPPDFHIGKSVWDGGPQEQRLPLQHAAVWSSAWIEKMPIFRRAGFLDTRRGGRQKIEKRSYWRSLLCRYPSETSVFQLGFPNQVPWPGQLERFHPS